MKLGPSLGVFVIFPVLDFVFLNPDLFHDPKDQRKYGDHKINCDGVRRVVEPVFAWLAERVRC
jgi:hypothetical protein